jgi:hypothetical protein
LQAAACGVRDGALDLDAAEVEERSELEGDPALRVITFRQRGQHITQLRSIECEPVDGDRNRALVVAEALEDGMQATDIAFRPRDQPKGIHRRGSAQGRQLRR